MTSRFLCTELTILYISAVPDLHLKIPGHCFSECLWKAQPECTSCKIVIDLCPFLQTPIMVKSRVPFIMRANH